MRRLSALAACAAITVSLAACVPPSRPPGAARSSTTTSATRSGAAAASAAATTNEAAWLVPAADVPTSPRSADWAARYWNHADTIDHDWSIEFGLDAPGNDYSVPQYSTADATTTIRVFQRPAANWNGHFDIGRGDSIPWNPSWLPSDGTDAFMVISDPRTGEEWDLWAVSTPSYQPPYLSGLECSTDLYNVAAGFDAASDLCAAAVDVIEGPDGKVADTRTYSGNSPSAGGGGIQNSAGLTTPAEVASGAIRHPLKFSVSAAASMTGPECPPDVTSPDDPRVGTTCGIAVAPAGHFENRDQTSTPAQLAEMIPEGTRLVIDDTDAQIEAWLDSRGYTGTTRETARVFAVALRDYGLIQTDTSGGPATISVSGGRNPATAAGWRALGITGDGADLLDGLVTASNIRVLEPAINQCVTGASRLSCWASSTHY